MKLLLIAATTLIGLTSAHGQEKTRIVLDCKATKIIASSLEESFSVDEYPEVTVTAKSTSNPLLPAIMEELQVTIGANSALRKGEDNVRMILNQSEGLGHKKYVVTFKDGETITVEAQKMGPSTLTSSDGSLEANLRCK